MTLGDEDAVEQLRTALAVGCAGATLVEADPARLGPADVARELAAVVRDREAAGEGHELVLLGNDAADSGDFQVGIRLAYELGWPVVNGVDTRRRPRTARSSPAGTAPRVTRPTASRCPPW